MNTPIHRHPNRGFDGRHAYLLAVALGLSGLGYLVLADPSLILLFPYALPALLALILGAGLLVRKRYGAPAPRVGQPSPAARVLRTVLVVAGLLVMLLFALLLFVLHLAGDISGG